MDDAGLNESVGNQADVVESVFEHDACPRNDDAHFSPSRWWFASSAFPMIAGTLGPVASAFSICALVRPWRQRLVPGGDIKEAPFLNDPAWLTSVNAIQLAIAVTSNIFLLLNMTRRVRFSIAQPITIVGWYISALCLIVLEATAAGPLLETINYPKSENVWSQAFYYGLWAAILYFVVATLMLFTAYGAVKGRYSRDFLLTTSQRTLMLQTIMFLMYLLIGALIFSHIEGWNYLDAIYWADVTLFTVGFGDFYAKTPLGRGLMIPYALIGVISLGLVIGSIRSLMLDRGKRQMAARIEEKRRRRVVRSLTVRGNDALLEPIRQPFPQDSAADPDGWLPKTEYERRKAEFELMRKIQAESDARRRWMAMAVSTSSWLFIWLVGAAVFMVCESPYQRWTYFDGFYFCFVSLVTIGYGDVTPISNGGKSFFVFWSLMALPTMTVLISNAGDTVIKWVRDGTIRLGNITILPGDEGFAADIRAILHYSTFGRLFPDHAEESERIRQKMNSNQHQMGKDEHESRGRARHTAPTSHSEDDQLNPQDGGDPSPYNIMQRVRSSLSRLRNVHEELPEGPDFHFLLISEIEELASHLRDLKPRRYSFDQWAWYLKLIGEDEHRAETHSKPHPPPKRSDKKKHKTGKNREDHEKEGDNSQEITWSWVGSRSPLLGSHEETQWILDRLVATLRKSLAQERHKHLGNERRENHVKEEKHKE